MPSKTDIIEVVENAFRQHEESLRPVCPYFGRIERSVWNACLSAADSNYIASKAYKENVTDKLPWNK